MNLKARRQIYSLLPLATQAPSVVRTTRRCSPLHGEEQRLRVYLTAPRHAEPVIDETGADDPIRMGITSALLYQ